MDRATTNHADAGRVESGFAESANARLWAERLSDLEASESRYRRLFETAKDGILIIDGDTGRIIDVNPFLTELMGYSHAYFLGKHLWELGEFKNIAASKEAFAELQAQTYVRYEDLPLEARDGRRLDVEFVSNVYRVGNDNTIQCNIRDVATRRRAERRTLQEHACLNAILESSVTPIYSVDCDYHYTAYNQAYAVDMKADFGVDVRVGGLVTACQNTREDWQATKEALDRALRGELLIESVTKGEGGSSRRYFETAYYPINSDDGKIIGVAVFARDVTVAKQAEDKLRFRNLILSTQLDSSLDGIQVMNALGKTISTNRRFADIWGISLDIIESNSERQLLQSMLEELVDPEDFERRLEHLLAVPDEEARSDISLRDGRTFDCYKGSSLVGCGSSGTLPRANWPRRSATVSRSNCGRRRNWTRSAA
jgi:PAS domain S-box-containing protein